MSITFRISPELKNKLKAEAKQHKLSLSKYITAKLQDEPLCSSKRDKNIKSVKVHDTNGIGEQDNIDLLLYTRGGDMVVPIRIVKLIRNYCKKFSILIPYRCHSAGTLICLGADEIIMTKLAELTPVDPTSASHPFNPKTGNPANPQQQVTLPVSVEDVRSYLSFAKEEYQAKPDAIVELYSKMTTQLHPLAMGNVYRVQKMIKIITDRLLNMHFNKTKKTSDVTNTIKRIVKEITEDICVHNYPIYCDEAKSLGLNILQPSKELEKIIWDVFSAYSDEMKLSIPFNPLDEIGANDSFKGSCYGAVIESVSANDIFNFYYEIKKITQPVTMPNVIPPVAINVNMTKMQWEKVR